MGIDRSRFEVSGCQQAQEAKEPDRMPHFEHISESIPESQRRFATLAKTSKAQVMSRGTVAAGCAFGEFARVTGLILEKLRYARTRSFLRAGLETFYMILK
jgi:hypothetical protein